MANPRNIFIINPSFQYKFSFIICSLVFLGSIIYPITIFDIMNKLIALQPELTEHINNSRVSLLSVLAIIQFAFIALVFVICIFLTHRIAGPMYKLSQYLSDVRSGDAKHPLYFRAGDNFHEVADDVNETIDYFKTQHTEDFQYLSEVSTYIQNISLVVPEDKKPILFEIQSKLLEIHSRYSDE